MKQTTGPWKNRTVNLNTNWFPFYSSGLHESNRNMLKNRKTLRSKTYQSHWNMYFWTISTNSLIINQPSTLSIEISPSLQSQVEMYFGLLRFLCKCKFNAWRTSKIGPTWSQHATVDLVLVVFFNHDDEVSLGRLCVKWATSNSLDQ